MTSGQSLLWMRVLTWLDRQLQTRKPSTSRTCDPLPTSAITPCPRVDVGAHEEAQTDAAGAIDDIDRWRLPALESFGVQVRDAEGVARRGASSPLDCRCRKGAR